MSIGTISAISFGFLVVWGAAVVVHALVMAAQPRFEPLAPEMPEHHGHGHDDHAHAPASDHH